MSPRNAAAVLLLLAASAAGAAEDFAVTIAPEPAAEEPLPPFRTCRVEIVNKSPRLISRVTFQDARGGMTITPDLFGNATPGFPIPPGRSCVVRVPLPPLSVDQVYRVRGFCPQPQEPKFTELAGAPDVRVAWPAEAVEKALAVLVDPQAYDAWAARTPVWPQSFRRNVLFLMAIACLAMLAAQFIPAGRYRHLALLAAVALAVGCASTLLGGQKLLFVQADKPVLQAAARRTWDGVLERPDIPIYATPRDITQDNETTIDMDSKAPRISTTIRPDAPRLFRYAH